MMFYEKVSPSHPDKIADRIAGAMVDLAYVKHDDPHIAVEVLIGHGKCHIITETDTKITHEEVKDIVHRISGEHLIIDYREFGQDAKLARNQQDDIRCGDNGIFKGVPTSDDYQSVANAVYEWYKLYPYDSKFIRDFHSDSFIACQSHYSEERGIPGHESKIIPEFIANTAGATHIQLNPIGNWKGGIDVDTGATNRKLGSDLGDAITGGGIHGKDLSKADVSINLVAHEFATSTKRPIVACCAIGDDYVDFLYGDDYTPFQTVMYEDIVQMAKAAVFTKYGSFERLAMWGVIAPEKFLMGET